MKSKIGFGPKRFEVGLKQKLYRSHYKSIKPSQEMFDTKFSEFLGNSVQSASDHDSVFLRLQKHIFLIKYCELLQTSIYLLGQCADNQFILCQTVLKIKKNMSVKLNRNEIRN